MTDIQINPKRRTLTGTGLLMLAATIVLSYLTLTTTKAQRFSTITASRILPIPIDVILDVVTPAAVAGAAAATGAAAQAVYYGIGVCSWARKSLRKRRLKKKLKKSTELTGSLTASMEHLLSHSEPDLCPEAPNPSTSPMAGSAPRHLPHPPEGLRARPISTAALRDSTSRPQSLPAPVPGPMPSLAHAPTKHPKPLPGPIYANQPVHPTTPQPRSSQRSNLPQARPETIPPPLPPRNHQTPFGRTNIYRLAH
ncbi:hypothetical protein NEDG_01792 [Nematocida displodere]|uniref:Uncharacterized protein n=1 Tax=Nematocida displodere TaxID=1805483 RepID=A0A177EH64_9MICR|nr:hypothetical protein NEDG_01792 [Nematocida displodere]